MATDSTKRIIWEDTITRTLNSRINDSTQRYTLLNSGQLVGAALCIFVRENIVANIRNVEMAIKKTGINGFNE